MGQMQDELGLLAEAFQSKEDELQEVNAKVRTGGARAGAGSLLEGSEKEGLWGGARVCFASVHGSAHNNAHSSKVNVR